MLHLTPQTQVQRCDEDVAAAEFENSVVLLHIENGEYYNFNATGVELWNALQQPKQIQELTELLVAKYDCSAEQCHSDLINWLEEASKKNLIRVV